MNHRCRCAVVGLHLRAKLRPAEAEVCSRPAGLDDRHADLERRELLRNRIEKAFQAPFGGMIQGTARKRRLAAVGGQADDAAAPCARK